MVLSHAKHSAPRSDPMLVADATQQKIFNYRLSNVDLCPWDCEVYGRARHLTKKARAAAEKGYKQEAVRIRA
eukprot:7002856-Pyramimonas_sp.AAC.1